MIWFHIDHLRGQEITVTAPEVEGRQTASPEKPQDVAVAISLLKSAIESIKTVKCKTVCSQMLPVKTGGKLFRDGNTILEEFTWEWNAQTSQMAVKGSHALAHPNGAEYGYSEFWGAFDGDKLRTFCEPTMKGQLVPIGTQLSMHFSVSALLGMDVGSGYPIVGIYNVLEGGTLEHDVEDPEAILLKSPLPTPERINPYQVSVWLDPSKGFLAKKFEMMLPDIGVTHYRTEILEFLQTPDGTWVPIKGKWSRWATEQVIPPGYTDQQVNSLSLEEFLKLGVTYRGKAFEEPLFITIDPDSLRVNEPLDASHFTIDFPVGAVIFDAFKDKTFKVTATGPVYVEPKPPGVPDEVARNLGNRWPVFLLANIILVLICGAWLVRRRIQRHT